MPRRRKNKLYFAFRELGKVIRTLFLLRYIKPDFVHVFVAGRVAEEGGPELADQLENEGYDRFLTSASA